VLTNRPYIVWQQSQHQWKLWYNNYVFWQLFYVHELLFVNTRQRHKRQNSPINSINGADCWMQCQQSAASEAEMRLLWRKNAMTENGNDLKPLWPPFTTLLPQKTLSKTQHVTRFQMDIYWESASNNFNHCMANEIVFQIIIG